jgi:hypothetical protein
MSINFGNVSDLIEGLKALVWYSKSISFLGITLFSWIAIELGAVWAGGVLTRIYNSFGAISTASNRDAGSRGFVSTDEMWNYNDLNSTYDAQIDYDGASDIDNGYSSDSSGFYSGYN